MNERCSPPQPPAIPPSAPVTSWIERTPGVCGGDACIRRTRIPVWGLVAYRRQGVTDAALLEGFPGLTPADLAAAWEYNEKNQPEIDEAIARNEGA
jgi:uncharacterized protein (DUF433 family)